MSFSNDSSRLGRRRDGDCVPPGKGLRPALGVVSLVSGSSLSLFVLRVNRSYHGPLSPLSDRSCPLYYSRDETRVYKNVVPGIYVLHSRFLSSLTDESGDDRGMKKIVYLFT